jgi:hypothetical protein
MIGETRFPVQFGGSRRPALRNRKMLFVPKVSGILCASRLETLTFQKEEYTRREVFSGFVAGGLAAVAQGSSAVAQTAGAAGGWRSLRS